MSTPNPPRSDGSESPAPHTVAGPLPPFNVMAIIAFVGAFVIPVVGIVCGHITLAEYRRGLPERGREYALAGLILGYIFTALWVALIVVWIVFAFTHFGHGSGGGSDFPQRRFPVPTPRYTPNGS